MRRFREVSSSFFLLNINQGEVTSENSAVAQSIQPISSVPVNMQNVASTTNQVPFNFNAANTMVDANGHQFYMIPVNSAQKQFQLMNYPPSGNTNVFSSGCLGARGQHGQC